MGLTKHIVRYRLAGLERDQTTGNVVCKNKVIWKLSRTEVAVKAMSPPDERIVAKLLAEGSITKEQAEMAKSVPMSTCVVMEADSGGHTDRRTLVVMLPLIRKLRDQMVKKFGYEHPLIVGCGGGIGDQIPLSLPLAWVLRSLSRARSTKWPARPGLQILFVKL